MEDVEGRYDVPDGCALGSGDRFGGSGDPSIGGLEMAIHGWSPVSAI